jgi:hypothetical protein
MVERQDRVPRKEWLDERGRPSRPWIPRARDQDDGDAVATKLICDGMSVDFDRGASVDDGADREYIRRGSPTGGMSFTKVRES